MATQYDALSARAHTAFMDKEHAGTLEARKTRSLSSSSRTQAAKFDVACRSHQCLLNDDEGAN